jgi:uncharacterized phage infection (PIP) family protein YhgE
MRRTFDWISLTVVIGVAGILFYTNQDEVWGLINLAQKKIQPCVNPVTYSIGSIDPRFEIEKEALIKDLKIAENIWDKPAEKNLLEYVPTGGEVTVSLVYDNRQASTNKLKAAGIETEVSKASYNALKSKYDSLAQQIKSEQSEYSSAITAYKRHQDAYNEKVNSLNRRGGASKSEYEQIQQEKIQLENEFSDLKNLESDVNNNISTLNALATRINQLIVQLNLKISQYNQIGASAGEFEEGLYKLDRGIQTITIYEYSDRNQLIRVLSHEMGHALGLNHVADEEAIMYKINQGKNLNATKDDFTELKKVCGSNI